MAKTTLTEFMELCKKDPFARTLYYFEVPRYYTWANKCWKKRKIGKKVEWYKDEDIFEANVLSRVYVVSPRSGDLCYLRLLLHRIKGPLSFVSLRTHDGHIYPSFKEACRAKGFLQADNHLQQIMEDAKRTKDPKEMRELFIVMLINMDINDPKQLWEEFKNDMSEDFLHKERTTLNNFNILINERHNEQALTYLQNKLEKLGKHLQDYNLPIPRNNTTDHDCHNYE